ncbi:hypothetical protein [Sandaracinus amylolyticus]|uniref:hypothetical protein n=1 Tax=Sandaracinus amylolyticus TaxID=927083 RepID=UPI0012EE8F76|nr:hypothetical protein [Sandaracinus amylolyticus]
MPSTDHELPLLLLRDAPGVLARLVRDAFGVELGDDLVESSAAFHELEPAAYVADLVVVGDEVVVVVEVQRARNDLKRARWPLYLASAHAKHARAAWLVVIALDEAVSAWAKRPIETFQGGALTPLVIGPPEIPRVLDVDAAKSAPELAVLSAMAHGKDARHAVEIGVAALVAAGEVGLRDEDRGKLYFDVVLDALADVARAALEASMKLEGYEYRSEFARHYVAQGRAEGLRAAVRMLCEAFGIEWNEARERAIATLDAPALERLCARLQHERRWPD